MSAHIIDSGIYRDQFGTAAMRAIFDDRALLRYWASVEAALARAEAAIGLIPESAAQAISQAAERADRLDLAEIKRQTDAADHPLYPFVRVFAAEVGPEAGEFVHWGATTQDIMDTACVLQLRDATNLIGGRLNELIELLAELARAHRDTPMAGRTHGQHALPITLGFKIAVVIAELVRHQRRLAELSPRLFVAQLAGAAGTLASFHGQGAEVQTAFCRELELGQPAIAWHSARDNLVEWVCVMAMIGATCGKLASEVIQLQRTEIAELHEPNGPDSVGSSTMPQKRNPMVAEAVVALARILRQQPPIMLDAMVQQHERDMSAWQAEWEVVPETAILVSGALAQTSRIYRGLHVDAPRMAHNLQATGGQINAEAVMLALAPAMGRQRAHHVIGAVARRSIDEGREFLECLIEDPSVAQHLDRTELARLLEPRTYLGDAQLAVDAVLASLRPAAGVARH